MGYEFLYLDHGFPESFEDKFEDLILFWKMNFKFYSEKMENTTYFNKGKIGRFKYSN